jgi:trans-2,3-dihydro-3-hydroxyanthranilate isomerase
MERWEFCIIDVFTDLPLAGNQLAVFEDASAIPDALLQPLAKEIGYAETVFAYPPPPGADVKVRIFTPEAEIKFAGHPTLGTAVLTGARLGKDRVVLLTGMGPVPVRLEVSDGPATRGTMEQPIPTATPYPAVDELLQAVGVSESILPVTLYDNGIPHVYVTLESPDEVAALAPDFAALSRLARGTSLPTVGFNVFAGSGREWKTRMFAPADGVPEDAATGSAAGPLALHLSLHGVIPWGEEIRVVQGVEIGRSSELFVRVTGNAESAERIEVGGSAVPVGGGWFDGDVLRGQLSA